MYIFLMYVAYKIRVYIKFSNFASFSSFFILNRQTPVLLRRCYISCRLYHISVDNHGLIDTG